MISGETRAVENAYAERGLALPASVATLYGSPVASRLSALLLLPTVGQVGGAENTIEWAEDVIDGSPWPLLPNLVPLLPVDERSFACVVASDISGPRLPGEGAVVRWHLGVESESAQAALLDTDAYLYAETIADELDARPIGLRRMLHEIGPAYELQYLEAEKRPRDFVIRPVRIACQNVLVALAAFAHDSSFDGTSVVAWQTCEAPHVAAHEANRALTALTLCDAFASGGTMEIRFDRRATLAASGVTPKSGESVDVNVTYNGHPEQRVPASLRRYARSVGVDLRGEGSMFPSEARQLFLKVTPMPDELSDRVHSAVDRGVASPERFCYALLSQIWREVELDFMLAVSDRAGSILRGGSDWTHRADRQAESELARAALMVGMLYRRLDSKDGAGDAAAEARVLEDNRVGVTWRVHAELAAVQFGGLQSEEIPWQAAGGVREVLATDSFTILPRTDVDVETLGIADELSDAGRVAVVMPKDAQVDDVTVRSSGVLLLRCPDRMGELDLAIERKLLDARISRA